MIYDRTLRAADRLAAAADRGLPCAPVRDLLGDTDIEAAYAVQREVLNRRVAAGARVVGRKVGLTSPAVQQQLGVEQPDFGVLFDDMEVVLGAEACTGRLMQPKAEAEVAFVLAADLEEGLLDASQVRTVVDYAVAAVEIVDSRIARWDITIVDTVADNASSGMFVLGQERRALADFEPVDVVMSMTLDGQPVSAGTGAACLGDPLNAVAWLARTARAMGNHLRKGDIILSGALGPMVAVKSGSHIVADVGTLGTVDFWFSRKEER